MLLSLTVREKSPRIFQSRQQYCLAGQNAGTTLQWPWFISNISWTVFLANPLISTFFRESLHLQQR